MPDPEQPHMAERWMGHLMKLAVLCKNDTEVTNMIMTSACMTINILNDVCANYNCQTYHILIALKGAVNYHANETEKSDAVAAQKITDAMGSWAEGLIYWTENSVDVTKPPAFQPLKLVEK